LHPWTALRTIDFQLRFFEIGLNSLGLGGVALDALRPRPKGCKEINRCL
jgi:hypothetical protein